RSPAGQERLAHHEFFFLLAQILVELHDPEREFAGFLEHDVFTHDSDRKLVDGGGRPLAFSPAAISPRPRRPSRAPRREKRRSVGWDIVRDCALPLSLLSRPELCPRPRQGRLCCALC